MNPDLDSALRDLAAGAAAAHRARAAADGSPVLGPAVRRVRRRRRVRGAAASVGSLAVAGALVLSGLALAREPEPQAAAPTPTTTTPAPSPTPTPSTTPAPSRAAVVLPGGDASLPFGACGSLASAAPAHPDDGDYTATVEAVAPTAGAGSNVELHGWTGLAPDAEFRHWAVPDTGPRIAVVRDGVVVGTGAVGGDAAWSYRGAMQGELRWAADWLPLAVCAPEGQTDVSAGAPLPAGDYELVPWQEVADLGASEDALRASDGTWLPVDEAVATVGTRVTAVGEPVPLTVTGVAEGVDPAPGAGVEATEPGTAPMPVCGEPVPAADPSGPLSLEWSDAGTALTAEDVADIDVDLRYTGGGRLGFVLGQPYVVVAQDGRVVGASAFSVEGDWRPLLASGTAVSLSAVQQAVTDCQYAPLPAGTYEVVVAASMSTDRRIDDQTLLERWSVVASEPATLVVP